MVISLEAATSAPSFKIKNYITKPSIEYLSDFLDVTKDAEEYICYGHTLDNSCNTFVRQTVIAKLDTLDNNYNRCLGLSYRLDLANPYVRIFTGIIDSRRLFFAFKNTQSFVKFINTELVTKKDILRLNPMVTNPDYKTLQSLNDLPIPKSKMKFWLGKWMHETLFREVLTGNYKTKISPNIWSILYPKLYGQDNLTQKIVLEEILKSLQGDLESEASRVFEKAYLAGQIILKA